MPKYSIIIPAHNDEPYIRKAMNSIKAQTITDYELIVICDSCTDNTEAAAKEYGAITKVVDFHRDGLSRNAGLDIATGEWVLFMDSDDWWLHEFVLDVLDQSMHNRDFDILCFGFVWKHIGVAGPLRTGGMVWPNVWSKLWRRSAIGGTRFSGEWSVSDLGFTQAMLNKGLKITTLDQPLYYYNYMRPGSITATDSRRKHE